MLSTRFAPSPSGLLHLGNAYSALVTKNLSEILKGQFFLRMEDIDINRCKKEFEEQILKDLYWLGISWTGSPLRQSNRLPLYSHFLSILKEQGILYGCKCSRLDIQRALTAPSHPEKKQIGVYPGTCAELDLEIHTNNVRVNIEKAKKYLKLDYLEFMELGFGPGGEQGTQRVSLDWIKRIHGDFVVSRKDIQVSYHLAVCVDDSEQGITHVSRGNDLFLFTPIHVLLQRLLGFRTPYYAHHRLIKDQKGEKLSKSKGATSLSELRKAGYKRSEVLKMIDL